MTSAFISLYTVQLIKFQTILRVQETEHVIAVLLKLLVVSQSWQSCLTNSTTQILFKTLTVDHLASKLPVT